MGLSVFKGTVVAVWINEVYIHLIGVNGPFCWTSIRGIKSIRRTKNISRNTAVLQKALNSDIVKRTYCQLQKTTCYKNNVEMGKIMRHIGAALSFFSCVLPGTKGHLTRLCHRTRAVTKPETRKRNYIYRLNVIQILIKYLLCLKLLVNMYTLYVNSYICRLFLHVSSLYFTSVLWMCFIYLYGAIM